MTREEIGELVAALPEGMDADEFVYKLVNWAVDREREACAKLMETHSGLPGAGMGYGAALIRTRKEK
jgi:hypothetical protein